MRISKEMKVAEVFEKFPGTREVFVKFGFGALMNPALRHTFGRMTSVEAGCRLHGVNLAEFLDALNASEPGSGMDTTEGEAASPRPSAEDPKFRNILAMKTDELVGAHPATREVFVKHFGEGCFSCPAFGQETVAFACSMHNTDPAVFAADCLAKIGGATALEIRDGDTVNELIGRYPAALEVFHRYGIDSCCGGAHPLAKAAAAHRIDLEALKKELAERIRAGLS